MWRVNIGYLSTREGLEGLEGLENIMVSASVAEYSRDSSNIKQGAKYSSTWEESKVMGVFGYSSA